MLRCCKMFNISHALSHFFKFTAYHSIFCAFIVLLDSSQNSHEDDSINIQRYLAKWYKIISLIDMLVYASQKSMPHKKG